MNELDARTLRCPLPLLQTKLWLQHAKQGEQLRIYLSDPGSMQDVPRYLRKIAQIIHRETVDSQGMVLEIEKT